MRRCMITNSASGGRRANARLRATTRFAGYPPANVRASRNAKGVSRHPNTRIDAELQATATYRFPQQALKSHIPATFSFSHFALRSPTRTLGPNGAVGGRAGKRHTTSDRRRATRDDHPPSYRPCTWHCLEKRRRRFEAPQHPYRRRVTGHSNIPLPRTGLKEPYPCYVLFKAHLGLKSLDGTP